MAIGTELFRLVWDKFHASIKDEGKLIDTKIAELEKQIDVAVNKLVATQCATGSSVLENKINDLERIKLTFIEKRNKSTPKKRDFEAQARTPLTFLINLINYTKTEILWRKEYSSSSFVDAIWSIIEIQRIKLSISRIYLR